MHKFLFTIAILLTLHFCAYCQTALLFTKNRYRTAIYKQGELITFCLKGNRQKVKDQILRFEDSVIVFRNFKISPKEISHLYVDNKTKNWFFLRYKYDKLFLLGGTGYLFLDAANNGEIEKETLVISGSLIGAGLLAKLLISKRIKIKGKRRLDLIHV